MESLVGDPSDDDITLSDCDEEPVSGSLHCLGNTNWFLKCGAIIVLLEEWPDIARGEHYLGLRVSLVSLTNLGVSLAFPIPLPHIPKQKLNKENMCYVSFKI